MSELAGIASTKDWLAVTEGIPIFAYVMPFVMMGITVGMPFGKSGSDSTECL